MRFSPTVRPFTLLIHIALAIILAGAIVTHYTGIQGELTLTDGGEPTSSFELTAGPGNGRFPFEVGLLQSSIVFYPGTTTPMDFNSTLSVGGQSVEVAMNRVGNVGGWRFYQSGITAESAQFVISYDPWGVAITYAGYIMLGLGFVGYFFQPSSPWRSIVRRLAKPLTLIAALAFGWPATASELPTMQKPLAKNLGKAYVYWNDRICPLQTMAQDVTVKLYGSDSYHGLTAEQVVAGWLFYYDAWARDYAASHPRPSNGGKASRRADECWALVHWLGTGEAFKIYPYHTADGRTEWLSLAGRKPSAMSVEQWKFMATAMPTIKESLLAGRNVRANEQIKALIDGQQRYAGADVLPSPLLMRLERVYNGYVRLLPPAIAALLLGGFYIFLGLSLRKPARGISVLCQLTAIAVATYIALAEALLWAIGGHMPLSNGPEMMLSMALVAMALALVPRHRLIKGTFLVVAAMALMVGVMGGRNPRVGMLMPVLASPLLSIHVLLVVVAYVLFMAIAIFSATALAAKSEATSTLLSLVNRAMLLPAVALLAAGIFVGAVWANQSWGRYWGWDPKETCALVVLLVYSLPLHWPLSRMSWLRRPKVLHIYLLVAILTVIFTYFGANYLLAGKHSYV